MADHKESVIREEQGTIRISEEVVAAIIAQAASEVDGVSLMTASGSGVGDLIGKKPSSKGVKILMDGNRVQADIYVLAAYGKSIPSLAQKVQERVVSSLQSMTGLQAGDINIHIGGIRFEREKKM
ncbi:MAG: Asp23/Gls24 family envelope stress response protein [Oscillospiraceae bacterium]|jgi:uncharacterized alkaline shock family protein YloU|nr:Asp23/Gls24 family envelope stress response protein [Oscillospiraceae bacterium]